MLYDIPAAIKSGFDAISRIFDYKKTEAEHQSEKNIIEKNEDMAKAIEIAINLFDSVLESNGYFSDKMLNQVKKDKRKFNNLIST